MRLLCFGVSNNYIISLTLFPRSTVDFGVFLAVGSFIFASIRAYKPTFTLTSVIGMIVLDIFCVSMPLSLALLHLSSTLSSSVFWPSFSCRRIRPRRIVCHLRRMLRWHSPRPHHIVLPRVPQPCLSRGCSKVVGKCGWVYGCAGRSVCIGAGGDS